MSQFWRCAETVDHFDFWPHCWESDLTLDHKLRDSKSLSGALSVYRSVFCLDNLVVEKSVFLSLGLSFYLSDIVLTIWTTVLITKLKSLSVFLSVCQTDRLSVTLLTFWTTFVLITKLKSWEHFLHSLVRGRHGIMIFCDRSDMFLPRDHVCESDEQEAGD